MNVIMHIMCMKLIIMHIYTQLITKSTVQSFARQIFHITHNIQLHGIHYIKRKSRTRKPNTWIGLTISGARQLS